MKPLKMLGRALAAAAVCLAFAPSAEADLAIRISRYNAAGVLQETTAQVDVGGPNNFQSFNLEDFGNFSVVLTSNIASSGGNSTAHSLTINVTYNGAGGTGGLGASDSLIVEFGGYPYNAPAGGTLAYISSNASPSTSGLQAQYVEMISGVFDGLVIPPVADPIVIPQPPLPGLLGTTTGVGTLGGASSVLVPNPITGPVFTTPDVFAFYQRFTFAGFESAGTGSLSAGSTLSAIPEPSTVLTALAGLPALGLVLRRRALRARAEQG